MSPIEATNIANTLLRVHGLTAKGWQFEIHHSSKRVCGKCIFRAYPPKKKVVLYRTYLKHNPDDQIINTIKHEIAHALAYEKYGRAGGGHGAAWREMCAVVGIKPERLNYNAKRLEKRYIAICGHCGRQFQLDKRPSSRRRYNCRACCHLADYVPLIWKHNPALVTQAAERAKEDAPQCQSEIERLLALLQSSDRDQAKRIRARLRSLGHRGGLR